VLSRKSLPSTNPTKEIWLIVGATTERYKMIKNMVADNVRRATHY
jgi:hypothetical protein